MKFVISTLLFYLTTLPLNGQLVLGGGASAGVCPGGIVGNGIADDTAALNALFAAAPNFSQIIFPFGCQMKITSTVTISQKQGLWILGLSGQGAAGAPGSGAPQLLWYGVANGTMLEILNVDGMILENFGFFPKPICNSSVIPVAGIAVDVDQLTSLTGITTDNTFRRLLVSQCGTPTNTGFIGLRFSNTSLNNIENQHIQGSTFECSGSGTNGIGIEFGPSANLKNETISTSNIVNCNYGVHIRNGTVTIEQTGLQSNNVAIQVDTFTDRLAIRDCDFENNNQYLVAAGSSPILMEGNRLAAVTPSGGQAAISVDHAPLTMIANGSNASMSVTMLSCQDECGLLSMGNHYQYQTTVAQLGWGTFQNNAISIQDQLGNLATAFTMTGNVTYFPPNGAYGIPPVLSGAGTIYFNLASQTWQLVQ